MDQTDFLGYNFYRVQNKILQALNFGWYFQSDEVNDEDFPAPYQFDAEVVDAGFGSRYRIKTGLNKVMVYSVCSLIAETKVGRVPPRENQVIILRVIIPENAVGCMEDNIWVTATSLADPNVSDSDWYIAHVTIPATIDIDPDILNLRSRARWIWGYIELPKGYAVENIDVGTVRLVVENEQIEAELWPVRVGDRDRDGVPDLKLRFDRRRVQALLDVGMHELVVIGKVGGIPFKGSDQVLAVIFGLGSIYEVQVQAGLDLKGLAVRFYTYGGRPQAEVSVEPGENLPVQVRHPEGLPVKVVELVLTEDNTAVEICTLASFVVTQSVLRERYRDILRAWGDIRSCGMI
jgi:hypothetical protein